jgi:ribonuclease HII
MLLIGIDEAGYGPLLGPLVVAGAAFRVPDGAVPESAEAILSTGLERACRRAGLRVDDSKRVHRDGGLRALERTVLPFARCALRPAVASSADDGLDALLAAFGCPASACRAAPWYAAGPPAFPLIVDGDELSAAAQALQVGLGDSAIEFLGLRADVLPEARLNERFDSTGNKAEVLFDTSAGVAERLLALRRPSEAVLLVFDRQGGRQRYLSHVQSRWPDAFAWTLFETPTSSAYRLDGHAAPVTLRFDVEADAGSPPVGLASMTAKYLREAMMLLWNGWFAGVCPDVRPTAGYTQDGRRWLEATRAARMAAGIPDALLVRRR